MSDLTPKEQEEYEKRLASYKPTGSFANCSINHFKPLVKDGGIDEQRALGEFGLNERQLPFLMIELLAAGYLKEEAQTKAGSDAPDDSNHTDLSDDGGERDESEPTI